mgnify:FL=1
MTLLSNIITVALILVAIAIIIVVLVQKTKSAGLGSAYGGDTVSFTAKGKAASREAKLQKLTIILSVIFGVLAIALAIFG